jgi:hypothetical protein
MHKTRSILHHKAVNNVPCRINKQQIDTLKIQISYIIKYIMERNITQKTQRALIFASKHSPIGSITRMFLPTIDIVILLLSIASHPRARAMNPQGWFLGQV